MRVLHLGGTMVLAALIAGCGGAAGVAGVGAAGSDAAKYDGLVQKFGEALKQGDYASAHALCSSGYRSKHPVSELQGAYAKMLKDVGKPVKMTVEHGSLPDNEAEAREHYGVGPEVPKSAWRAYSAAEMGVDVDPQGQVERGFDVWVLIADEQGQPKIAAVEMLPMD